MDTSRTQSSSLAAGTNASRSAGQAVGISFGMVMEDRRSGRTWWKKDLVSILVLAACLIHTTGCGDGDEAGGEGSCEITEPTPLLNPDGSLAARGWARHPIIKYNPEYVLKEHKDKLKEWEHYTIQSPKFAFEVTMADITWISFVSLTLIDYAAKTKVTGFDLSIRDALTFTRSPYGDTTWKNGTNTLTVRLKEKQRVIEFDIPAKFDSPSFKGKITLLDDPQRESLTVAQPFSGPGLFFLEDKVFALPASGEATVGTKRYTLEAGRSYGVLDWGRGVWPAKSTWYWGAGAGTVQGKVVGYNVGYGSTDISACGANGIIHDGVIHKISGWEGSPWKVDHKSFIKPWKMTGADRRLDLVLTPFHHDPVDMNLGLYAFTNDKVHGTVAGSLVLDDGTVLEITDFIAFAEYSVQTW